MAKKNNVHSQKQCSVKTEAIQQETVSLNTSIIQVSIHRQDLKSQLILNRW